MVGLPSEGRPDRGLTWLVVGCQSPVPWSLRAVVRGGSGSFSHNPIEGEVLQLVFFGGNMKADTMLGSKVHPT